MASREERRAGLPFVAYRWSDAWRLRGFHASSAFPQNVVRTKEQMVVLASEQIIRLRIAREPARGKAQKVQKMARDGRTKSKLLKATKGY